jgi:hypothetical protein
MPKFFFHYRENDEYSVDEQGVEFDSVEEAYLNAYHGAVDMWSELLKERRDPRRCAFEVTNDREQLLFVFPFTEALDVCREPKRAGNPFGERLYPKMVQARSWTKKMLAEFQEELKVTRSVLQESRDLINSVNRLKLD